MKSTNKKYLRRMKRKSSVRGNGIRIGTGMYAWAKPYNDPNIINVPTGLGRGFKYSPIFKKCIADTMVELTGYRRKDYVIAEAQTGKEHTPRVTVWHHAWEEKNGKYRMQLVDFEEHKKTCPHAGGCKLWLQNTKKRSKYLSHNAIYSSQNSGDYSDLPSFYSVESTESNFYQKGYVSKSTLSVIRKKKAQLVGVDMYGNLLYKNAKNLYFWDHESDSLILLNRRKR